MASRSHEVDGEVGAAGRPGAGERGARVHVKTGAVCNNNCSFCMEEDREQRRRENGLMTPADVERILDQGAGAEEVCFTSGEPTTNPRLAEYARAARSRGYRHVSLMTNGRRLSHEPYTRALVAAGIDRIYVSIHGHTRQLHEGLTRAPGSFEQTVRGIAVATALARRVQLDVHTSTVLTPRNLPHLPEIYRFLRGMGVHQVVFNVPQAGGRAKTNFEHVFPRYEDVARAFRAVVEGAEESRRGEAVMAFLVDAPPCTTEGIPALNRGWVEPHVHYLSIDEAHRYRALVPEERLGAEAGFAARARRWIKRRLRPGEVAEQGGGVVELSRDDLDLLEREHRPDCSRCIYRSECEGVWTFYVERRGWSEFVPIEPPSGGPQT